MKYLKCFFLILFVSNVFYITTTYGEEKNPILVGATVSLAGKYAEPSGMIQKGYKLWAKQLNEKGGLLGRQVKLILYDDKSQKELVGSLYEKLIIEDKVDLILSPYGTPLTMIASEISEKHEFTMLACAAAGEKIWDRGYKYIFGVYALADRYFIGFLDLMARNGFESVGIIYENSSFHISIAKGVKKWAERFDLKINYDFKFEDRKDELSEVLKQVTSKHIDGLIFSAYPLECYKFIDLMKTNNSRPNAIAFTIVPIHPEFNIRVGSFSDKIFGPSQWEPDKRIPFPGTKQFINDFKAFTDGMPSYHATSAYSACQILERSVTHLGLIDQKKIRDYISSFDTVTIMGRFKVDPSGRQIGHNPILIQWQNGKKEIVYPTKMKTSNYLF